MTVCLNVFTINNKYCPSQACALSLRVNSYKGSFLLLISLFFEFTMTSQSIFALFPAIPLAIAALNFRYISIATLMRDLSSQIEKGASSIWNKDVINGEIIVLQRRMKFIKISSLFCGVSFITNLSALYFVSIDYISKAQIGLTITIGTLIVSMGCFCIETYLSTKALNMHIAKLDDDTKTR